MDLCLMGRGMMLQVLTIVRQPGKVVGFNVVEGGGKGHVAEFMMMPVRFAVGGDVQELRPVPPVREAVHEALGKRFAAVQQVFEGHRP